MGVTTRPVSGWQELVELHFVQGKKGAHKRSERLEPQARNSEKS